MHLNMLALTALLVLAETAAAQHAEHAHQAALAPSGVLDGIVAEFALVDAAGETVTAEDFRGRYVLLGFGFTNCPDVCPLMAANMGLALRQVDRPANGIFVSVDTERDDVARTHAYAANFGDAMLGLGGTREQIAAAARNFKVRYVVTKTEQSYTVQHTSSIYLIDPEGRVVEAFSFDARPAELAAAMR